MPKDNVGVVRQYDFSHGPNYTDSIYSLTDKELAESADVMWDGEIKTIPGAGRYISSAVSGTTHNFTGIYQYVTKAQATATVIATDAGRVLYNNAGSWQTLAGGLSTSALALWDWVVFNNTLIGLSGKNSVKKWGGSGATFGNLGGSPPQSKYGSHHAVDYLFFAGHTSNPSQIRYSDTATAETWPVGNVLEIGHDDNQIITGLQRFGDTTAVFKNSSIWLVAGNTPTDFSPSPTPSDVGCIAPYSIVLTDAGIFFWSEAGPALFNGFKSTLLGKRLKAILDEVDWSHPEKIWSAYYPARKQILVGYQRSGQSSPDRILLLDLYRLGDNNNTPPAFWPITASGFQVATNAIDATTKIRKIIMGHSTGHVTTWDNGSTTFNTNTITSRIRTGALHLGKPDRVQLVRDVTLRTKAQTGRITLKYSMDGNQTFTTHTGTPYSTAKSGYDVHQKMLEGTGAGNYMIGNILQIDVTSTGSTGFNLHGFEVGSETTSRRDPIANG